MSEWMTASGTDELNSYSVTSGVDWDIVDCTAKDEVTFYVESDTAGTLTERQTDPSSTKHDIDTYDISAGQVEKIIYESNIPELTFQLDTNATVTAWYEWE